MKRELLIQIKHTVLFAFCCWLTLNVHSQYRNTISPYKPVSNILESSINNKKKLELLYILKEKAECNNDSTDAYFAYVLFNISILEYSANKNLNTALKFSLAAADISRICNQKIKKEFLINLYCKIGFYYDLSLRYNNALAYYDTVLQLNKQVHQTVYQFYAKYNRTREYFAVSDYQKSIEESTLALEDLLLQNDSCRITFLNWRAQSFMYENLLKPALVDLNTLIPLAEKLKDTFQLAFAYKTKAFILDKTSEYDSAEYYFKKTIDTRIKITNQAQVTAEDYQAIAEDYIDLGNFYVNSLKQYDNSKKCYYKTIEFAHKCIEGEKRMMLLCAYEGLAQTYLKENNINQAIRFYTFSFQCIDTQIKNILFTSPSSAKLGVIRDKEFIFTLLIGKIELFKQIYENTKQQDYIQSCIQTARLTDSFLTQTRHEQSGEQSKLYWRDKARAFFTDAIEVSYLFKDVKQAFYFMEKSRAALLNDKWNELGAKANLPERETDKQEYLQTKIIEQEQQLSSLQPSSKQYEITENNLSQVKDSLEHFIKYLENNYPAYYQYKYADDVPSLDSLQKYTRQNNQSFVYYFMNDTSMYALGITKNKTSFIKITATDFDSHQLSSFIQLCSDKKRMMNNYPAYALLSQTIYKKLFLPLQIPKGNVAICTDNFFIPFEALCTDEKGKNFLLYNYNFSYAYSARSLLKTFTYSKPTGNFIGFAPVSFSSSLGVFDLKQSAVALQNVANFYIQNTLLTQQQATRKSFFEKASHYSVVTIFSHAQADTTDKEPVLYMQDSLIHLSDLQRLNNPAIQFVLLSACQTNIGKNATGEGIYSLARGFASAGIPSVSATLWKADEGAVYQISTKFNEYLSKGANKSEALQKAKIWYLQNNENKENSLPYYWANMVLIGSSQPVVLASSNHLWIWLICVIFFIILLSLMAYVFYKKKNARKVLDNVV